MYLGECEPLVEAPRSLFASRTRPVQMVSPCALTCWCRGWWRPGLKSVWYDFITVRQVKVQHNAVLALFSLKEGTTLKHLYPPFARNTAVGLSVSSICHAAEGKRTASPSPSFVLGRKNRPLLSFFGPSSLQGCVLPSCCLCWVLLPPRLTPVILYSLS